MKFYLMFDRVIDQQCEIWMLPSFPRVTPRYGSSGLTYIEIDWHMLLVEVLQSGPLNGWSVRL